MKSDFEPHDKLSEQQVANLDELVSKAHKLHLDKDPGAEKLYQLVLDVDPVHYECLTNLAKIAYSRNDLDRSRNLFERAIVLRPEHEKNIYYLAIVLFDMEIHDRSSSSSLLLSSLELSDTKVYEPEIRALLGTAAYLYENNGLELRTVPTSHTSMALRSVPISSVVCKPCQSGSCFLTPISI